MRERLSPVERFLAGGCRDLPVVDGHFHLLPEVDPTDHVANLGEVMRACGMVAINIAACTAAGSMGDNLAAALAKACHPGQVYAFGGLHHHLPGVPRQGIDLADQARRLIRIGFDGIKMIEGKPAVRAALGYPLDALAYDQLYAYLEAERVPILFHVGDPASFWEGVYRGAGMPERETLYAEIERVLDRFPNLRVIFAHFFFLADDLVRAGCFLDRHPTASFDLTPHPQMYAELSQEPERAREFFVLYKDRIVFGTDNHAEERDFSPGAPLEYWPVYKVAAMRAFLETDDEFEGWHHRLRGIALEDDVLTKIYRGNLLRYVDGGRPKPLDACLAIEECQRLLGLARRYAVVHRMLPVVRRFVEVLRSGELQVSPASGGL